MFPSRGYFRSANCPFGSFLCHRPYCHFRHSKPEYKPSSVLNTAKSLEPEKKDSETVKETNQSVQNNKPEAASVNTNEKITILGKVDKTKHETTDEPVSSTKSIFKRTALEEKLIAISSMTDEILSESDSEPDETLPNDKKVMDLGVAKVSESVVGKDDGKIKGKISNEKMSKADEAYNLAKTSGVEHSVTSVVSKPATTNEKSIVKECEILKIEKIDILQNEESKMAKCKDTNEQEDLEKIKVTEPTEEVKCNKQESTGIITVEVSDDSCDDDVVLVVKEDGYHKTSTENLETTDKSTKCKEDKNLNAIIQDLQKYGKGMDVEVKTTKENDKIESLTKQKRKAEPPKLTDVNFFGADVAKPNKRKSSKEENIHGKKEEKVHGKKLKKEEKIHGIKEEKVHGKKEEKIHGKKDANKDRKDDNASKERKKLKKKLSEGKLATIKEKSKIQRYKELKKLVNDSENNVITLTDNVKDSASLSGETSGIKRTERANEVKELVKGSKKTISASTECGKISKSASEKDVARMAEQTKLFKMDKDAKKKVIAATDFGEVSVSKYSAGKTELNKVLNSKDVANQSKGVVTSERPSVVILTSDSEGCGDVLKANINARVDSSEKEIEMEDDSEENELLRLFNDYDPHDEPDVVDSLDDYLMDVTEKAETNDKMAQSIAGIKRPSTETVPSGFKKQRIAHQPNLVIQRSTVSRSNANTFRRVPRPLQGTLGPPPRPFTQAQPQGERDLLTSTNVKQRVTHFTKSSKAWVQRPRIRLEYGAKVPQSVRQKYLDKLVDEYLCVCEDQQDAFNKAEKDEKEIYTKSPRRQMYINLCVNLIKKLRDGSDQSRDSDEVSKRNPLASKSTLPSPSKRLRVDPSSSASFTKANQDIENSVEIKPKGKPVKDGEITEDVFYTRMQKYVLTEEDLVGNGYPRPSSIPGRAEITDSYSKVKKNPNDPTRHICCRCGKPFVILESGEYRNKEECVYHHGRLLRNRTAGEIVTTYTCCQGEAGCNGCSISKAHVRATDWSEETGFAETRRNPELHARKKVYALDCEMCYTTKGLELTRVTVVDYKCRQVYDTLVKPENDIVDYNTRFSGITEECMIGVSMSLRDVQSVLLSMFYDDTILLGHSLESDLRSLKIIHSTVVDTAIVFPHRLGLPFKRALRTLMGEYVRKIIQDSEEGHDSLEDAVSCVELMLWRIKEDMKIKERKK